MDSLLPQEQGPFGYSPAYSNVLNFAGIESYFICQGVYFAHILRERGDVVRTAPGNNARSAGKPTKNV